MFLTVKIIEESNSLQDCALALSHLREHKFKHSFQNTLNPVFSLQYAICPMYNDKRHTLLSTIKKIGCRLLDVTETVLIETLLSGNCSVDAHTKTQILNPTNEYILATKKFDEYLFHS